MRTFLVAFGFEAALGVLALILGRLVDEPAFASLRLDAGDALLGAAVAVPLVLGFVLFDRKPAGPLRPIHDFLEATVRPLLGPLKIWQLALVCAAAGLGEEALFRGFLLEWLQRHLPVSAALVISSALFGLAHFVTAGYAGVAAALGLLFGWLHVASGNLLVPVVSHGLYDFLALLHFLRGKNLRKLNFFSQ